MKTSQQNLIFFSQSNLFLGKNLPRALLQWKFPSRKHGVTEGNGLEPRNPWPLAVQLPLWPHTLEGPAFPDSQSILYSPFHLLLSYCWLSLSYYISFVFSPILPGIGELLERRGSQAIWRWIPTPSTMSTCNQHSVNTCSVKEESNWHWAHLAQWLVCNKNSFNGCSYNNDSYYYYHFYYPPSVCSLITTWKVMLRKFSITPSLGSRIRT